MKKLLTLLMTLALCLPMFMTTSVEVRAEEECLHELGSEGYTVDFTSNEDGATHLAEWSCSICGESGTYEGICSFYNNVCNTCGQTRENQICSHEGCDNEVGIFATCDDCSTYTIVYESIDGNSHKVITTCQGCSFVTETVEAHDNSESNGGFCPKCNYGASMGNQGEYHTFLIKYNAEHKVNGNMNTEFAVRTAAGAPVSVITRQMVDYMVQEQICLDSNCSVVGIYTDSVCSTEFSQCDVIIGETTTVYLKFDCNHTNGNQQNKPSVGENDIVKEETKKEDKPSNPQKSMEEVISEALAQAVEEKIKAEEAIPVTDFVSTEAVNAIPAEVKGTSTDTVFNVSKITTTRGFVAAVDKIVKENTKEKTVSFYSATPFAFNDDSLNALTNANKDFVYMFKHEGKLYKITIPAGAKIDLAGQRFAGPLYIGAQLGTSVVVK